MEYVYIVVGIALLFWGGEWLVQSACRLATSFGVPILVISLTIVAIGTSAPELLVSVSAAMQGKSEITIGNIIGSNIANIGLILAIAGLVRPLKMDRTLIRREIPLMVVISLIVLAMAWDGDISRIDGGVLLLAYVGFNVMVYTLAPKDLNERELQNEVELIEGTPPDQIKRGREVLRLLFALALLAIGAQATLQGAVTVAQSIGISELVIGLTIVAIGTSLPELVASITSSARNQGDIAAGNIVGSNIGNILLILGLTGLINPIPVSPLLLRWELPAMIAFAAVLLPMLYFRKQTFGRIRSGLLLAAYLAFTVLTVLNS
jgi:cation:H+ antiporter